MSDIEQGTVDNAQLHDELENTPSNKSGNTPFASIINKQFKSP